MDHRVIGVLGASGGLGASTLAVALALRAARRRGVSACVDGDLWGGGLDVTACLEHLPGLRWGDLGEASGELDGAALLRALPCGDGVCVLAAGGEPPGPQVVRAVVPALSRICAVTVLDLGRAGLGVGDGGLLDCCTHLVLLAGTTARGLADGVAAAGHVGSSGGSVALVLRASRHDRVDPEEVAVHLDLPLAAVLPHDARAVVDADRGRAPGERAGGVLATVADRLLDWSEPADLRPLEASA
jgi:hypothetical protein